MNLMTVEIANGRIVGYERTDEFAKKCGVKPSTVRVWESRGKIKTLHVGRDRWVKEGTPYPAKRIRVNSELRSMLLDLAKQVRTGDYHS